MSLCTCCRRKVQSVAFISALHGNLCQDCFDQYRNSLTTRETSQFTDFWYKCADELGITADVDKALKELHKRYQTMPWYEFDVQGSRIVMRFLIMYRGKRTKAKVSFEYGIQKPNKQVYLDVITKQPTDKERGAMEEYVLYGGKLKHVATTFIR